MSTTYPDLTNDYPDIESDERYLYRDINVDDLPHIVTYETFLNAVKNAADDSTRQAAWEALNNFKTTDDYINHVYPVMMSAVKLQTLEDKVISAQRFAKRQKQQWVISETQPESNEQAVDDIWLRSNKTIDNIQNTTPFYKGDDGQYHEFNFGLNIKVVSSLPSDPNSETLYIVTGG